MGEIPFTEVFARTGYKNITKTGKGTIEIKLYDDDDYELGDGSLIETLPGSYICDKKKGICVMDCLIRRKDTYKNILHVRVTRPDFSDLEWEQEGIEKISSE